MDPDVRAFKMFKPVVASYQVRSIQLHIQYGKIHILQPADQYHFLLDVMKTSNNSIIVTTSETNNKSDSTSDKEILYGRSETNDDLATDQEEEDDFLELIETSNGATKCATTKKSINDSTTYEEKFLHDNERDNDATVENTNNNDVTNYLSKNNYFLSYL